MRINLFTLLKSNLLFENICFLQDHANMFSKTYSLESVSRVVHNYSKWSQKHFRKASIYPWSRYSHFIRFMSTCFLKTWKQACRQVSDIPEHSVGGACEPHLCMTRVWAKWNSSISVLRRASSESHTINTVIVKSSQYILMWVLCFFHTKSSNQ